MLYLVIGVNHPASERRKGKSIKPLPKTSLYTLISAGTIHSKYRLDFRQRAHLRPVRIALSLIFPLKRHPAQCRPSGARGHARQAAFWWKPQQNKGFALQAGACAGMGTSDNGTGSPASGPALALSDDNFFPAVYILKQKTPPHSRRGVFHGVCPIRQTFTRPQSDFMFCMAARSSSPMISTSW